MKVLDLFCGAGGASAGYHSLGFEVTGVDINPQPHYPYEFIQSDWEEALWHIVPQWQALGEDYLIHASPPCQRYSTMTKRWDRQDGHPDLIGPVREALQKLGGPYIIENVPGSPLINPTMLCGSMFGLRVRRHRMFETNFNLPQLPCLHSEQGPIVGVYGHSGGSSKRDGLTFHGVAEWKEAMGIDWMTGRELAEAIPPAYTQYVGNYATTGGSYVKQEAFAEASL